jgi:hypothetical protein
LFSLIQKSIGVPTFVYGIAVFLTNIKPLSKYQKKVFSVSNKRYKKSVCRIKRQGETTVITHTQLENELAITVTMKKQKGK